MSDLRRPSSIQELVAIHRARHASVPIAYASGCVVVLVLEVQAIPGLKGMERLRGRLESYECAAPEHARLVADRVVADLELHAHTHTPREVLEVSAQYADAAYRNALRRRRVA